MGVTVAQQRGRVAVRVVPRVSLVPPDFLDNNQEAGSLKAHRVCYSPSQYLKYVAHNPPCQVLMPCGQSRRRLDGDISLTT
jgi:hypothetical protein